MEGSPDQPDRDSSEASQLQVARSREHLLAPRNLGAAGQHLGAEAGLRAVTRPTRFHRLKEQSWKLWGPHGAGL